MAGEQYETLKSIGAWRIFEDRPVRGLENSLGRFVHGSGPGPEGPQKPIPLFFQLLDPEVFDLGFTLGDQSYEVLTADQKRFSLPRALPPLLALLLPGDDENPTGSYALARYPYSEDAFELLHDLLDGGYRFSLKEFLRLASTLASALAFLHSRGIVHGQWNSRSLLCVPVESERSPLDEARSYRFDLLNTGVRYRDAEAIPPEYLERGYFPKEVFPPPGKHPDYEAFDLETDVYCFCAFLADLFRRASRFEELTQQASTIRDFFFREAIRKGEEPSPELVRLKEQEILDHLHTIKVKIEEMIQGGLRARGSRTSAEGLAGTGRMLYEKVTEYMSRLFETGFGESVNVFEEGLQHYVPYRVTMEPEAVNQLETSTVTLSGQGLPAELIRVSLGSHETLMEVAEAGPGRIAFKVPAGFEEGTHPVLINNRRTNVGLEVIAPRWIEVSPSSVRRPWVGFGNIRVRVSGENLPERLSFGLRPEDGGEGAFEGGGEEEGVPPGGPPGARPHDVSALGVELVESGSASSRTMEGVPEVSRPASDSPGAERLAAEALERQEESGDTDERGREAGPSVRTFLTEFAPDLPVGRYALLANGLETGLSLAIEEALPEPVIEPGSLTPADVLNHREQRLELRGRNFHPSMLVDLGEETPPGFEAEVSPDSDRLVTLILPRGFPAGEYTVRVNREETKAAFRVRQPVWTSCQPSLVRFGRGPASRPVLTVRGTELPFVDPEVDDSYRVRTARGREIREGVLASRVVEDGTVHEVELSPRVPRGRHRLFFGEQPTGLAVRIRRKLSVPALAGVAVLFLGALVLAAFLAVPHLRPEIAELRTVDVYNFGDSRVELAGSGVLRVRVREPDGGKLLGVFRVERLAPEEKETTAGTGAGGETPYSFRLQGVPPGRYEVVPQGFLLLGEPAEAQLRVLSPEFRLEPRTIHRFSTVRLELTSAGGFPLEAKAWELRLASLGEGSPREHELELSAGGEALVPAGTFAPPDERSYGVVLDGVALTSDVSADGEPVRVEVVGPEVEGVEPERPTLSEEGTVSFELVGSRLPSDVPLGLTPHGSQVPEGEGGERAGSPGSEGLSSGAGGRNAGQGQDEEGGGARPEKATATTDPEASQTALASHPEEKEEGRGGDDDPDARGEEGKVEAEEPTSTEAPGAPIAYTLRPTGPGTFEGRATPGDYGLAWDLPGGTERIRGVLLKILPPPKLVGIDPSRVTPETPVRLELSGVNLLALETAVLRPISGEAEDPVTIELDPARVSQDDEALATFTTEPLTLKTGRYTAEPGSGVVLEVIENCRELLAAYRRDREGRDKLLRCLEREYARDSTRRDAAGVFFDQGLFAEALRLYEGLDDLKSRFRAAFVRHFVNKAEMPGFETRADDVPQEPYFRAAAALGWAGAEQSAAPTDPNGPWDLDFVRGYVATDPRVAVEALALAIEKKRSAAAGGEIKPFPPAYPLLAKAQLDLGINKLERGAPIEAREHLRRTFLEENNLDLLSEPDLAAFHFYFGHLLLWYSGDRTGAEGHFRDGMLPEGRAFGSLSRLYLEALGADVPPSPLLYPMLPTWERDFVNVYGHYRRLLSERRYDILTESTGFAFLDSEEQEANLDLFKALERLEETEQATDPFAQSALLFFIRNAQRLAWPTQQGGQRAAEHRERFRALRLSPEAERLREFYILQAEVEPLAFSQLSVMPRQEIAAYMDRVQELLGSDIPGSFKNRLSRFREFLSRR